MNQIHATCIHIDGTGVLLRGQPGSGKSDLALRLIDQGARLIADDRVDLQVRDGRVVASAPVEIAGLFEVRGLGVLPVAPMEETVVGAIVDLVAPAAVERVPEREAEYILGVSIAVFRLAPFEASAPAKVRLAVRCAQGHIMPVP